MRLTMFRVTNYRSVDDSGWIDVDDVTALIGVNESGKTNLLLPLWKMLPADDGEIQPTSDYPKSMFGEIRQAPEKYQFIEAEFDTGAAAAELAAAARITCEEASSVRVARLFDGNYKVAFPRHERTTTVDRAYVCDALVRCADDVRRGRALKQETGLHGEIHDGLIRIAADVPDEHIGVVELEAVKDDVQALLPTSAAKTSAIVPIVQQLVDEFESRVASLSAPPPGEVTEVLNAVIDGLPRFIYYASYGNLDSEIYLPHVVDNMEREDLGTKEAAKARTLRVLFSFVKLQPREILELGRDPSTPTDGEMDEIIERKRTRSILLQSASTKLTKEFREWWRQGDHRFRFEADGNHFRIWVSDDTRPTEVELENRSSGMQWFLSFYLVFLVESLREHKGAVLLLDEPGTSLHPLAQRDLSAFFDSLSTTNQLIYTSHSPFLVDADRLERARKVYLDSNGTTKATANLTLSEGREQQTGAAYAVHSALNLRVAESLLLGCKPILVEGPSDQHYLTAIKALLVSAGEITPSRELVFPPSGGARTVRVVASILTGRDETLPTVLLDSDRPGRQMAKQLIDGLYGDVPERVLSVSNFVDVEEAEVEDLFPVAFLAEEIDRMEREPETRLADVIKDDTPFVDQVEEWATSQSIELAPHWKVALARRVKSRALQLGIDHFQPVVARWVDLFNAFDHKNSQEDQQLA